MSRFVGACRFVYNKALVLQKERYEANKQTRFSYTALANLLPVWKRDEAIACAVVESKGEIQQQLEESQTQSSALARSYWQRPPRLPAQSHNRYQPKPRDGVH